MASANPGFDTLGTVTILAGIYLLWSAVKNKQPITAAKSVVLNPGKAREALRNNPGYTTATPTPKPTEGIDPNTLSAGGSNAVVAYAEQQIGKPYIWGGVGPKGYDCSGLVIMAWKQAGVSLPHYTGSLLVSNKLEKISTKGPFQPGDLIFPFPGHVQLYAGNGLIIEAPGRGRNLRKKTLGSVWQARRVRGTVTL